MKKVWCVKYLRYETPEGDTVEKEGWCATYKGHQPSEAAFKDQTACANIVMLRVDSKKDVPTCEECKRQLRRRRRRR